MELVKKFLSFKDENLETVTGNLIPHGHKKKKSFQWFLCP